MSFESFGLTLRKFGVNIVGDIPWGTHLCQFYQTKQDLIDILVPYFAEGLKSNELCIWVTSEPLEAEEAKEALRRAVPNLDEYSARGQIEILSYKNWYLVGGSFDADKVLKGWVEKEKAALARGLDGLRLTGNTFWIERNSWGGFVDYEAKVNEAIGKYKMIALCTYSLDRCTASDVVDVVRNHRGALIRKGEKWNLVEDVAKRKEVESRLEASEEKYRNIIETTEEGVWVSRPDGVTVFVNQKMADMLGYAPEEFAGRVGAGFLSEGQEQVVAQTRERLRRNERLQSEYQFRRKDGTVLWTLASVSAVFDESGQHIANLAMHTDITKRKRIEEMLRQSERRWATTLESIGDAVITTDMTGRVTFMNLVGQSLTGWKMDEAVGKPLGDVFSIVNEGTGRKAENPVTRVLAMGKIVGLANHTILLRRDGMEVAIDDSGSPIRDESGSITGVVLTFRDVTQQRRMERNLTNLAKFPSENPDPVLRLSKDGKVLFANPASLRLLEPRLEADQVVSEEWRKHIAEALSSGAQVEFEEMRGWRWFSFSILPIASEDYVNIYGREITGRKKAERELQENEALLLSFFDSPGIMRGIVETIDDVDLRHIRDNEATARYIGLTAADLRGKLSSELGELPERIRIWLEHCRQSQISGQPVRFEYVDKQGSNESWLAATVTYLETPSSGRPRFAYVVVEVTERKKAEIELKESEERFRMVVENSRDGINMLDLKTGRYVFMSPAQVKLTGFTADELNNISVEEAYERTHPEDREITISQQKRVAAGEDVIEPVEYRWKVKSGEYRWFSDSRKLVRDEQGQPIALVGITRDITERKRAENELKRTHDYLDSLLNYANAPIITWDSEFKITRFNHAFERLTGYRQDDIMGKHLDILFPEDRKEEALGYIKRTLEGERWETVEIPILTKDKKLKTALWNSANIYDPNTGKIISTIAQGQDITERKQAEETLRETRDYLDNLLDYANAPVIVWDPQFKITRFNHAFERITGHKAGDVKGKGLDLLFPKDRKEEAMGYIKRTLAGEYWVTVEIPILHMDGTVRTLLWNSANIYDPNTGKIISTIAQGQDITERKTFEEALKASENRLRDVIESSPIAITIIEPGRTIIDCNKAALDMYGVKQKRELLGRDLLKLTDQVNENRAAEAWEQFSKQGNISNFELDIIRNDGQKINTMLSATYLKNSTGEPYGAIAMLQDVTENKKLEEKVKQTDRLRTIGETAVMVGHDLRNPLQVIMGYNYLIREALNSRTIQPQDKQKLGEMVDTLDREVKYMNKIVSDLQDFTQNVNAKVTLSDMQETTNGALQALTIPRNIKVSVLVPDDFSATFDPSLMRRVLINLITNSVQAMPNGGKLTIRASRKGKSNVLTVQDRGVGIKERDKPKIFNPLFTTKAKGQGLGLAVCKKLIEAQGGKIGFESTEGKGTKFIIRLP